MGDYIKNSAYAEWMDNDPKVFVSKPYFKLLLGNGAGIYILNSHKYNFIPKFYFTKSSNHIETGINFAGWICEFMWNKSFKV